MSDSVFSECTISTIQLKNRILCSATHLAMADEGGRPTEMMKKYYLHMAHGEVGGIIIGSAGIQQSGKSFLHRMLMIDNDQCIDHYRDMVAAIHETSTPVILQIAHCGRQTRSKTTGCRPEAPSAIKDKFFNEEMPEELSEHGIYRIIDNFVDAVERAKKAGFDGVQLHAAHGYLLAQFLSAHMNRRKDRWGGSLENRFRIIEEIFTRTKERVGSFPLLVKLNGHEGKKKRGMTAPEAVEIAKMLENKGCAAIEVSCGIYEDGMYVVRGNTIPVEALKSFSFKLKRVSPFLRPVAGQLARFLVKKSSPLTIYNVPDSELIKKAVSIPVIVVGGIKSIDDITDVIAGEKADFVSMCRPFVNDQLIVKKFKEQCLKESKCIYCNYCLIAIEEQPLKCYYGKL